MSDEFKLEEDDAPTIELEQDGVTVTLDDAEAAEAEADLSLDGEGTTEALDPDDAAAAVAEDDGNGEGEDEEEEDDDSQVLVRRTVSEGSSIGAFTGMLILSFVFFALAAGIVIYQISMYSDPASFTWWKAPMP